VLVLLGQRGHVRARVSRIHLTVVRTNSTPPTADRIQVIVVPITISVIEMALSSGMMLGPGR